MTTPRIPTASVASSIGASQPKKSYSIRRPGWSLRLKAPGLLGEPGLLHLEGEIARKQIEGAVRHVDHPHQAEDQG